MSGTILSSPKQAANTFSQFGGFPRQRNVFILRFITNVAGANFSTLTFAAKSIDRPRINPKTEQLNQYNKKRQILTGYTLEPVRVQFFDSADGSAQNMWTAYGRYYYGDLNNQTLQSIGTNLSYSYDITLNQFKDYFGTGFGFTATNNGSSNNDAQFFFDRVEIYHFYDGMYDCYHLVHPRISSWEPDDLDYENSGIAMLSATLVYENLQYFQQQPVIAGQFPEFQAQFNGNPVVPPNSGTSILQSLPFASLLPSNPSIASLLSSTVGAANTVLNYRVNSVPSGGSLGLFGNFTFGPSGVNSLGTNLSTMSLGNPALTSALNLTGATPNPLASSGSILAGSVASSNQGINGASYDVVNAQTQAAFSGYGSAGATATAALLTSQSLNGGGASVSPSGQIVLPSQAYGAINSQQTGTAQYGFNTQTDESGDSWGYNGPSGFTGPNTSPQNFGPFTNDEPSGIEGRFDDPGSLDDGVYNTDSTDSSDAEEIDV